MGVSGSASSRQLATLFGDKETEGKRGPTLGSALVSGPEGWRLILVAPVCIKIFDAHAKDGKAIPIEDTAAEVAIRSHVPFTACSTNDDEVEPSLLSVGCQDGTVLVFSLGNGTVSGLVHELRVSRGDAASGSTTAPAAGEASPTSVPDEEAPSHGSSSLEQSIAVLRLSGRQHLFGGVCGRCFYWDLNTGNLQREFQLPAGPSGSPVPSTLAAVGGGLGEDAAAGRTHLWVGMDNGSIAVFDISSGMLVRCFSCNGPEALVSLAVFPNNNVVFALSAHRRVSVWDASSYACMHTYTAELMTCGADLSAMIAVNLQEPELSLLMLAGVDSSLCVRRVSRRPDGKLNCVLLYFLETVGGDGAPITSLNYHETTDSVLVGDAGCSIALLTNLKDQLGTAVQAQNEVAGARTQVSPAASPARDFAGQVEQQPGAPQVTGVAPPSASAEATEQPLAPPASPPSPERAADQGDHGDLPAGAPMFLGS